MVYQSETIATIIGRLNSQYFLPAIQREFVWSTDQIIKLFDSVMRGYPVGSFLFWQIKPENREKWEAFKFLDHAQYGGTHNEPANTAGVQQLTLVLDGQQRLTAFLIGLKGAYTIKKKWKHWDSPDAWEKQELQLDLFRDPRTAQSDGEEGIRYGFEFRSGEPVKDSKQHWFKVSRILDFDSQDRFDDFSEEEIGRLTDDVTVGQQNALRRNLESLYRAVWKDAGIAYHTEHDQDADRVLDIFVRANSGGTILSKSDLLLSMVTANWGGDTKQEIFEFLDRINGDLTRKNNFDKDFIMKTCLVISDLPVGYRVDNFSRANLQLIHGKWKATKSAIERGVDLVNQFGIDRDCLTSANALIPLIYYLFRNPGLTLRGSKPFDVRNAATIRQWVLGVLLNNVFGGQSDTVLREARRVLQEQPSDEKDFPVQGLNRAISALGKKPQFDDLAIESFLDIRYGRQTTFLAVSVLYDEAMWGTQQFHIDHIFPRALFKTESMVAAGVPPEKHERFQDLSNQIENLQLLLPAENLEKSSRPFEQWITTRDASFHNRHLIPRVDNFLKLENFEEFVLARGDLIRERLLRLFAPIVRQDVA